MIDIENHTIEVEPVDKKEIYGKDSYQLSILSIIVNPLPLLIFGLAGICIGFLLSPFLFISAFFLGLYSRKTYNGKNGLLISVVAGIMYLLALYLLFKYPPFY